MNDRNDNQFRLFQNTTDTWRFLEERGLRLVCLDQGEANLPDQTHVIFSRNAAWYGVKAYVVREIMPLEEYVPLPFTQPYILGLVGIGDQMMPVLDMCSLVTGAHSPPDRGASLVIVHLIGMDLCLLADSIVSTPGYCHSYTRPYGEWQRV
jgi:purine-binding chemotaxis protein CheW